MTDQKEKARLDYLKGMKYKDIAEKYNVTLNTVKSWKTRYKWSRESVHTDNKSVHTKKQGGQPGNKNARGHGAPKKNTNAIKHGLFSKYLPQETLQIVYEMDGISPIDILWMNIELQFAQIVRSQQIMHVNSKDDLTKELKRTKHTDSGWEEEYELQFAWDKQASFLQAQSRAMATLQGLIKQFDDMATGDDIRRLKLEHMRIGIEKSKAELAQLSGETEGNAHDQVNSYVKALDGQVEGVFADEVLEDEEA